METIRVYWKDKFGGRAVAINRADFDPTVHRTEAAGPWLAAEVVEIPAPVPDTGKLTPVIDPDPEPEPTRDLDSLTVAQLRNLAADEGIELKHGLSKADIIKALREGSDAN